MGINMGKSTCSLDQDEKVGRLGGKPKRRGFFNAVANRLAAARLGDLMVESGLISKDQLNHALDAQRTSKKQLGAVLIDLGFVSPINLYKKLAEQWVIKASAAGLTMLISTGSVSPRNAMADGYENMNITFASAVSTTKYSLDDVSYPALFGTREVKSNDISGFSNWTGMINRFQVDLQRSSTNADMQKWKASLSKLKGKSFKEKIVGVNRLMNSKRYITDKKNWNKSDYWATPVEFMTRGGDCEDFAIAKYASLRALGVPAEQMRLAIVLDKKLGIHHAILIVYDAGKAYVLDNQDKAVKDLTQVRRYKPIFSINQQSWWLHKRA